MISTGVLEVCGVGLILPLISVLSVESIGEAHPMVIQVHRSMGYPEKTNFKAPKTIELSNVFGI